MKTAVMMANTRMRGGRRDFAPFSASVEFTARLASSSRTDPAVRKLTIAVVIVVSEASFSWLLTDCDTSSASAVHSSPWPVFLTLKIISRFPTL